MSYSILYRSAFIKVDENTVVPIYEAGDNNVYDVVRNRRSRSWQNDNYYSKGRMVISNDELMSAIIDDRNGAVERYSDYSDDQFSYFMSVHLYGKNNTTFNQYKSFYMNGIKKARTIEEYALNGVRFSIYVSQYSYKSVEELNQSGYELKPSVIFNSTEHMLNTIAEYLEYYKDTKVRCYLNLENGWSYDRMLDNEKIERKYGLNSNPKKAVEPLDEFWTITNLDGGYLVKFTKYGYKYRYTYPHKKFKTEKQANAFLKNKNGLERFVVKFIPREK